MEADLYLLNTIILRLEVSVLCEALHFFQFTFSPSSLVG